MKGRKALSSLDINIDPTLIKQNVKQCPPNSKLGSKRKRRAPVSCSMLELVSACGKQIHKVFREEDTCFSMYDIYKVELKEMACDNDCLTDDEQIRQSRHYVMDCIGSALKEVSKDKRQIKNYENYQSAREIKKHRVI